MTSTLTALRRRILECPWDDGLRMYYADCLEEVAADKWDEWYAREIRQNVRYPNSQSFSNGKHYREGVYPEYVMRELLWMPNDCDWEAMIHRGFVSEVEMKLSDFMTHAGELFASQPITGVRLTDRKPFGAARPGWFAPRRDVMELDEDIPKALWKIAAKDERRIFLRHDLADDWAEFETEDDAHAALSAACVAYGRNLAGLPPLAVPVGV